MTTDTKSTPKIRCRELLAQLEAAGYTAKVVREEFVDDSQIEVTLKSRTKNDAEPVSCNVANWAVAEHLLRGALLLARIR